MSLRRLHRRVGEGERPGGGHLAPPGTAPRRAVSGWASRPNAQINASSSLASPAAGLPGLFSLPVRVHRGARGLSALSPAPSPLGNPRRSGEGEARMVLRHRIRPSVPPRARPRAPPAGAAATGRRRRGPAAGGGQSPSQGLPRPGRQGGRRSKRSGRARSSCARRRSPRWCRRRCGWVIDAAGGDETAAATTELEILVQGVRRGRSCCRSPECRRRRRSGWRARRARSARMAPR